MTKSSSVKNRWTISWSDLPRALMSAVVKPSRLARAELTPGRIESRTVLKTICSTSDRS